MAPANILTICTGLGLWLVCQLIWHRHYRPDAQGQGDIAAAQIDQLVDGRVASLTFQIDTPAEGLEVRLRKQHAGRAICLGLFITELGDSARR